VSDGLHQATEFALIGRQLGMLWRDVAAEEGDGTLALMKDGPEARAVCVTVADELLAEIRELKDWTGGKHQLESVESGCSIVVPSKRLLLEQSCERGGYDAVVVDETAVVAREA